MNKKILLLFLLGILLISLGLLSGKTADKNPQDAQNSIPTSKSSNISQPVDKPKISEAEGIINGNKKVLVSKILDGDTVETDLGEKIRYLGINTPEKGQPFANEATKLNQDLVLGKEIDLEFDIQTKDRYGRTLAYVHTNGIFVNLEIIKKGFAVSETIQPNVKHQDEIVNGQKESRDSCLGIWEGLCSQGENGVLGKKDICVKIISINANAFGDDNKNKNGEWIEIKNSCQNQISMDSWLLKDNSASNAYTFKNFIFEAGKSIMLYSGCGNDQADKLYWKCPERKYAIWNNSGDSAFLYNEKGELISNYSY